MAVDYDVVVIGGTVAGVQAARRAAQLKARVALVTQQITSASWPEAVGDRACTELFCSSEAAQSLASAGVGEVAVQVQQPQALARWAAGATQAVDGLRSLTELASQGIDVIDAKGEFRPQPRLNFQVEHRQLTARAYLLTPSCRFALPILPGLDAAQALTPEQSLQPEFLSHLPARVAVVGDQPAAVQLAQRLNLLGAQTTLITNRPTILPLLDPELAHCVQAQLEADGITVLTQTDVVQLQSIQGQKWLQVGNQALEVDDVIFAISHSPEVGSLNLDAVGVRWSLQGIEVNPRLQTTQPQIYACEGRMGDTCFAHLAQAQAQMALRQALFWPLAGWPLGARRDRTLPVATATSPEAAWVGLTEPQARHRYGKDVVVLRQPYRHLVRAQVQGELTGLCKLILRRNGQIIGGHGVGPAANEWINAIALAMQHRLPITALINLTPPTASWSEIVAQTAAQWQEHRLAQDQGHWLEWWFDGQRSWSR